MSRHLPLIILFVATLGVACGCSAIPESQSAIASDTVRIPIIELALRGSGDPNAAASAHTEIYVAHVSRHELDAWLTSADARAAAQLEGRPVDEIEAEWRQAGIKSVPELDSGPMVWLVDIRGIRHEPPPLFSSDPRDWDPNATAGPEEPFVYDNFHMIFSEQGAGMGSGAFVDADATPPLGTRVPLEQVNDARYVLEVALEAMPTAPALDELPTATPAAE